MNKHCTDCNLSHKLYYQMQKNNTKHLIMLCPQTTGKSLKTIFLPFISDLPIEILNSKSLEYKELKIKYKSTSLLTKAIVHQEQMF